MAASANDVDPAVWDIVQSYASSARVARHTDKVFKSECMFCFRQPASHGGLFVNLGSHQGFCQQHVHLDQKRSGGVLYFHIKHTSIPEEAKEEKTAMPEKLAIGVPGGFDATKPRELIEEDLSLAVMPAEIIIPLPCDQLPSAIADCIASIQAHESASTEEEIQAWQEDRKISKYAENLSQLPSTKRIPMDPKQWKCEETGVSENLWLNLSTGFVGSGRPNWDGSGGNGAALRHFDATGKQYPLVVKLGTITPSGADVFSYADDENDMVLDPKLGEHLAHWGINMMQMEKTEKTITELQIEKNLNYEFDKIMESGTDLKPLSGQGFVGLKNLGNSCYMNSILQLLWCIPELQEEYVSKAEKLFETAPEDPYNDFITQFAKLGNALAGPLIESSSTVAPLSFKTLVGRGHPEFSSSRQQDAQEYFSYLVETAARAEHGAQQHWKFVLMTKLFELGLETRIECSISHRVSYAKERTVVLSLEIPLEAALNEHEISVLREQKRQKLGSDDSEDGKLLPRVPLVACIEKFAGVEEIDDYYSPYLKATSKAMKSLKFTSFPPYLMVHLRRYYVDSDWTPKKLEVLVEMPENFSLEYLRSGGRPLPGEELQPDTVDDPTDAVNENLVAQLMAMGFPEAHCKRAALSTGNADIEAAMEWLLTHEPGVDSKETGEYSPDAIKSLENMGFSSEQAKAALSACQGNLERAVDWLFSHADAMEASVPSEATNLDGRGEYELVGFLSHMGKNTSCGHYVSHIKKDGKWIIFNDEKVAISENPPFEFGYMYLYKRMH